MLDLVALRFVNANFGFARKQIGGKVRLPNGSFDPREAITKELTLIYFSCVTVTTVRIPPRI